MTLKFNGTSMINCVYVSMLIILGNPFRYRLQTMRSLAGVSLMLRLLWACLRWDDMAVKPSSAVGTTRKGEKICTNDAQLNF